MVGRPDPEDLKRAQRSASEDHASEKRSTADASDSSPIDTETAGADNERINQQFIRLARRAESIPAPVLANTFVNVGHLMTRLSTDDHQIIYGRRGTGKTHALYYLTEYARRRRHAAVFVDLRTLGSAGGIYNDPNRPLSERGTALLVDVLSDIHSGLYEYVFSSPSAHRTQARALELLDVLAENATQTQVVGDREIESTVRGKKALENSDNVALSANFTKGVGLDFGSKQTRLDFRGLKSWRVGQLGGKGRTLGL